MNKEPTNQDHNKSIVDGLYLFGLSEHHSGYIIPEFHHYFTYALLHNKARLFYSNNKPVGVVTWCFLDDDKAEAFADEAYLIEEDDYIAEKGDQLWGIEFIAPFGHTRQMMRSMRDMVHKRYPSYSKVHWKRVHTGEKHMTRNF
jgi:hemolysin-activating ACP:hemolysin acyltransferase